MQKKEKPFSLVSPPIAQACRVATRITGHSPEAAGTPWGGPPRPTLLSGPSSQSPSVKETNMWTAILNNSLYLARNPSLFHVDTRSSAPGAGPTGTSTLVRMLPELQSTVATRPRLRFFVLKNFKRKELMFPFLPSNLSTCRQGTQKHIWQ